MKQKHRVRAMAVIACVLAVISSARAAEDVAGGAASNPAPRPAIVNWRSVESADYQAYVNRLQAIGCPPQTIRTIVTADVIAAFAGKREAAVAARYQDFQYWRCDPSQTEARAKLSVQRSAIDEQMNGVLQQLLGAGADLPDVGREWQREAWNQELAFLAPNQLAATKVILEEFATVNRQMGELAAGLNLTDDTNKLQRILARYREEQSTLHQVLSPEDYQLVEMTVSWTAKNLRRAMVHFEPTEPEFRGIFEAWQPHDENLARLHALRQPDPGDLEKGVYAKIKSQLSAARYEQYCATWWE